LIAAIVTDESFTPHAGVGWAWSTELLQQLLNYAVAAGLIPALPGGSAAAAAVEYSEDCSLSCFSSTSGVLQMVTSESWLAVIADSVIEAASDLVEAAGPCAVSSGFGTAAFIEQPVVADVALHLLALRCWQIHQQLQEQQQQQGLRLSPQLGRQLHGDLLLLPDPAKMYLRQLVPKEMILTAQAISEAESDLPPEERCQQLLKSAQGLASMLLMHSTSISAVHPDSPMHSAEALQLSAELLLRAAMQLQLQYVQLPESQQALLLAGPDQTERNPQNIPGWYALSEAHELAEVCFELLQKQVQQLWDAQQWQPQFRLLQHGAGQVLLQGLTLAVHCSSLYAPMQGLISKRVTDLLKILDPYIRERAQVCCYHKAS
jgi:hypothetical protein